MPRRITEEPRAAIRGVAGLARLGQIPTVTPVEPLAADFDDWGLPLVEGEAVTNAADAVNTEGTGGRGQGCLRMQAPGRNSLTSSGTRQ